MSATATSVGDLWQRVLAELQAHPQVSRAMFATFLAPTQLMGQEGGYFVVRVPHSFAREKLERQLKPLVEAELQAVSGVAPAEVRFVVTNQQDQLAAATSLPTTEPEALQAITTHQAAARPRGVNPPAAKTPPARRRRSRKSKRSAPPSLPLPRLGDPDEESSYTSLHPRYTFQNFIVGKTNQLAHAAARAVADHPAGAYNPLFLYGGVGLGKTHLLHAIGHHVLQQLPGTQVLYVTTETFTNDFINHVRRGRAESFRNKYRTTDILLIDDIQFLAGKEQTQEEFFHTFNTLHGESRQVVLTSDRPPAAIAALEDRLRSRFAMGLIADIQPPDFETRVAILRAKAALTDVHVPPPVLDFIAQRVSSNIRELEGALTRVAAAASLTKVPLTLDHVAATLSAVVAAPPARTVTPDEIMQTVASVFGISVEALRGKARAKHVVVPRQIVMYLMRHDAGASLVEIGQQLGGRDHSTVLYGCKKIMQVVEEDPELRRQVQAVRARLAAADA